MNYTQLATELLNKMQALRRAKPHKHMSEALQGEAFVLQYIAQHGKDVLPGEISAEMDVSSARIAAALNKLESKGLITRQIDLTDRRKILVSITQDGEALAAKHQETVTKEAAKMLELLGEEDAKEYIRITGKLAEKLPKNVDF